MIQREKIRVLIVHENPLFRAGLCSVLERHEEIYIVGQTVELEQLLELTALTKPVVLFDGALTSCQPTYSAVEVVDQVRRAGAPGIMVFAPALNDEESLFRFFVSGATAYELPTISGNDLVEKIRRVASGEYLISNASLHHVSARPSLQKTLEEVSAAYCQREDSFTNRKQGKQPHDPSQVTDREITVLKQIMKGCSNKQIARALGLSDQTVKNHITSILKKFKVHDRTAAVVVALGSGLILLEDIKQCDLLLDKEALAQRTRSFVGTKMAAQQRVPLSSYAMAANA